MSDSESGEEEFGEESLALMNDHSSVDFSEELNSKCSISELTCSDSSDISTLDSSPLSKPSKKQRKKIAGPAIYQPIGAYDVVHAHKKRGSSKLCTCLTSLSELQTWPVDLVTDVRNYIIRNVCDRYGSEAHLDFVRELLRGESICDAFCLFCLLSYFTLPGLGMIKPQNNQKVKEDSRKRESSYLSFEYLVYRYNLCMPVQSVHPPQIIERYPICSKAFELIYGLSNNKLKRLKREIKTGKFASFEYDDSKRADSTAIATVKKGESLVRMEDGTIK